ncbi:MAG: hypothetical protein H7X89_06035 [Rhizobiales bacterium]|nr:hypothetical protein [Hyphomicrobiales bacterium]
MTKTFFTAAVILAALAGQAFASYPPIKYGKSRAELAQSCATLGAKGQSWGLDRQTGAYGCRNTENGNAVHCTADGKCADYSGDPRWKRIQILLKGGKEQKALL